MHDLVQRVRSGGLAMLLTLAAGISLLLLTRVDAIEFAPQLPMYRVSAGILLAAAIGPLIPEAEPWFRILLWNGTGWTVGLAVFGLESVGAMPLWPIMLAALALTFWPRSEEKQLPASAVVIALLGGFLVCWLGWSQPDLPKIDTWVDGL